MVCPRRGHTIPRVSAIEMPTTDLGLLYSDQLPFKLPTLIPYVKPRTLMITQPDTVDAPSQGMHRKGIYIVANDRVQEQAIALLNSIRRVDAEVTVILIPFDDHYQGVFGHLHHHHGVQLFPDLDLITAWTDKIGTIFPKDFLNLPNKLRKIVTWLGPLDQFLYIDADIIVFDRIAAALDYLDDYDFICCDYHHRGRGIQDVFAPLVVDQHLFTAADLQDVFNSGFWGSRKDALSPATLEAILRDCAAHREYFDFSQKTTDQPLLNYLVLKTMARRFNLVRLPDWSTGSWAGSPPSSSGASGSCTMAIDPCAICIGPVLPSSRGARTGICGSPTAIGTRTPRCCPPLPPHNPRVLRLRSIGPDPYGTASRLA